MEKETSSPSHIKTTSPSSSPKASPTENQDFATLFTSMYHSIFPPKSPLPASLSLTPSTSSSSATDDHHQNLTTNAIATEHRLNQARLILECQELCDHYDLCLARLQSITRELDSLRQENADLRLANTELLKLLSLSSQASIHNSFNGIGDLVPDFSARSLMEPNRLERKNVERISLPKSISVRSSGYLKVNESGASNSGPSRIANRQRVPCPIVCGSQRVYVPAGAGTGGKREEDALEFEVYNQGMWKTELCNKWQETGTCPYGDHCQFAHGITELRPVIRHPRYKTEVCRMVLTGDTCPYGHRCHFRHSLTEQERLLGPR